MGIGLWILAFPLALFSSVGRVNVIVPPLSLKGAS